MGFSYKHTIDAFFILLLACVVRLAVFTLPPTPAPQTLTAKEMRQDLYQLIDEINQFSAFYVIDEQRHQTQLMAKAQQLSARYTDTISQQRFAAEVNKLLYLLDDPGAQLAQANTNTSSAQLNLTADIPNLVNANQGVLPILLRPMDSAWLALDANEQPLDADFPFITHIDGLPMTSWVSASQAYLPKTLKLSPTMQRSWLHQLNVLRQDMGLVVSPQVRLTLSTHANVLEAELTEATRPTQRQVVMSVARQFDSVITHQAVHFRQIDPQTTLIELTDLDAFEQSRRQQNLLRSAMANTYLVLDVRRAHGHSQTLMTMLSQYADIKPNSTINSRHTILGLAKYRLSPHVKNDYLQSLGFSPTATTHVTNINDEYAHPEFSTWLTRTQDVTPPTYPNNYLVLLISPECQQDCEWLAYSAKAWKRATLVGEHTAGNLAKRYHFRLHNSQLDIAVSAALIFNANGELLSGVGTAPDIALPYHDEIEWPGLLSLLKKAQSTAPNLTAEITPPPPIQTVSADKLIK